MKSATFPCSIEERWKEGAAVGATYVYIYSIGCLRQREMNFVLNIRADISEEWGTRDTKNVCKGGYIPLSHWENILVSSSNKIINSNILEIFFYFVVQYVNNIYTRMKYIYISAIINSNILETWHKSFI